MTTWLGGLGRDSTSESDKEESRSIRRSHNNLSGCRVQSGPARGRQPSHFRRRIKGMEIGGQATMFDRPSDARFLEPAAA